MMQPIKKLSVTIKQANDLTGLSVRKIYNLISEGKLQSITVGRRRLILFESLEKLLTAK